jgi:PAS domain S-box-containing protein
MPHSVPDIAVFNTEDTTARLLAIIESTPTAIVMVDEQGKIIFINREASVLFGYSSDELLGKPMEILVPERFRRHHPDLRTSFFTAPSQRPMGAGRDLYALRRDGSEFPVAIGLNPITLDNHTFTISAIVDLTERKRLESLFRATVESAPTAMIMVDHDGHIVLVNAETEKVFGYERHELLGKNMEILVPEEFRMHHPHLRHDFFSSPQARRMGAGRDLYALRRDGSKVPVEIGLNPVVTSEGTFILSAIVDITERKQLEAALLQANEQLENRVRERTAELAHKAEELQQLNTALERSNTELQQFAYIASHDLQSPLRSISGFVQLLQSEYGGRLDERADDWIRRTVQSIRQMQSLIRDLLAYSNVDSQAYKFQPASFHEIFEAAISRLDLIIHETSAHITCDELPTVIGDRLQLIQLLQNILDNALKYRSSAPPRIHVSARHTPHEWIFSVRDNGIGIDPKHHTRIFDIFRRLHDQQEYPGTGIGLAICRRIVYRHGGTLWLESEPGHGTTFYFTIPERNTQHYG